MLLWAVTSSRPILYSVKSHTCSCRHTRRNVRVIQSLFIVLLNKMDKFVTRTKRKCEPSEESDRKKMKAENGSMLLNSTTQTETAESDTALDLPTLKIKWREIRGENLNCDYCRFLSKSKADDLLRECEDTLTYNTGDLAKVHIYGKWLDIPRKQVSLES